MQNQSQTFNECSAEMLAAINEEPMALEAVIY
jgi:hypothetical protein